MAAAVKSTLDGAKVEFARHLQIPLAIARQNKEFVYDQYNTSVITDIFHWCLRDVNGNLDPEKGLWICGTIGSGKSTIMQAVISFTAEHWIWRNGDNFNPKWINASKYCGCYAKYGFDAFDNIPMGIDELGSEIIPSNFSGNKLNVMAHMIQELDNTTRGIPRIVTSRCRMSDISDAYGDCTIDRISGLYNIVELLGPSRRPSSEVWRIINDERNKESKSAK